MTVLDTPTGSRRRRGTPPASEESVRQPDPPTVRLPDPPIYRDLVAHWAGEGRTVPGRRDPEWSHLTSSPVWPSGPLFGG
ncbi:hypothetical protein [Streptomyces sp. NPDC090022]|uniref:hypothetical protein n=1 Tax=Streptomyces sp. NPDC090022 TaxID=3365920 RepID=UPI0037F7E698